MNKVLGDRLSCNTNLLNSCIERYYGDFECVILQHILMIDTSSISSKIALKLVQQGLIDHKPTLVLVIDGWGISCKIVLIWSQQDLTDDNSTFV